MGRRRKSDVAWAAGLFEGEGCWSYSQNRARASMVSTDLDVLQRFRDVVVRGTIGPSGNKKKPHHKDRWQWWANGDDFVHVFTLLLPWLCTRRLAKGKAVLDARMKTFQDVHSRRQCKCCGAGFAPNPKGKTTKAKMAGASRTRYCSKTCRVEAKNQRRRKAYAERTST